VPLSIQVYKWLLVNLMLGCNLAIDLHPIWGAGGGGGKKNFPGSFLEKKLGKTRVRKIKKRGKFLAQG